MPRRCGADAAERRGPPSVSGTERPRQDDDNRILAEIESAAAMHTTFGNGVKVPTEDKWSASGHCCDSFHEPIVLFEPPALPIRLRNGRCELSVLRSEEHTSELQSLRHLVCR